MLNDLIALCFSSISGLPFSHNMCTVLSRIVYKDWSTSHREAVPQAIKWNFLKSSREFQQYFKEPEAEDEL